MNGKRQIKKSKKELSKQKKHIKAKKTVIIEQIKKK